VRVQAWNCLNNRFEGHQVALVQYMQNNRFEGHQVALVQYMQHNRFEGHQVALVQYMQRRHYVSTHQLHCQPYLQHRQSPQRHRPLQPARQLHPLTPSAAQTMHLLQSTCTCVIITQQDMSWLQSQFPVAKYKLPTEI